MAAPQPARRSRPGQRRFGPRGLTAPATGARPAVQLPPAAGAGLRPRTPFWALGEPPPGEPQTGPKPPGPSPRYSRAGRGGPAAAGGGGGRGPGTARRPSAAARRPAPAAAWQRPASPQPIAAVRRRHHPRPPRPFPRPAPRRAPAAGGTGPASFKRQQRPPVLPAPGTVGWPIAAASGPPREVWGGGEPGGVWAAVAAWAVGCPRGGGDPGGALAQPLRGLRPQPAPR